MKAHTTPRRPDAPYLDVNFYFPNEPEHLTLKRFVEVLLQADAQFAGSAIINQGPEIRDKPYINSLSSNPQQIEIISYDDFLLWNSREDVRIDTCTMTGASGAFQDVAEMIAFLALTDVSYTIDRHPLAVWTEGTLFDGPLSAIHEQRATEVGLLCCRRFNDLVHLLQPAYATISIEEPLHCPTDLRQGIVVRDFTNFYIDETFLGAQMMTEVIGIASMAHTERLANGVYISGYKHFNTSDITITHQEQALINREVAKRIGNKADGNRR